MKHESKVQELEEKHREELANWMASIQQQVDLKRQLHASSQHSVNEQDLNKLQKAINEKQEKIEQMREKIKEAQKDLANIGNSNETEEATTSDKIIVGALDTLFFKKSPF